MKRVVVTGIGAVTPLGCGIEEVWSGILKGNCGLTITDINIKYETKVYGKVPHGSSSSKPGVITFEPLDIFGRNDIGKEYSTFIQYAIYASDLALLNSNLLSQKSPMTHPVNNTCKSTHYNLMQNCEYHIKDTTRNRCGVVIGSGGLGSVSDIVNTFNAYNISFRKVSPYFVPKILGNMAAGYVSIRHGFKGPLHSAATACAAGSQAIGDAYNFIRLGYADVILAGGAESNLDPLSVAGFARLKALSTSTDPMTASRPFDANRNGFVISEGACVLVLEELTHALERNAPIIAEVTGYGLSSDAYHGTTPSPTGDGAVRSMRVALSDAGLQPEDIGYINAHATSTPVGDAIEAMAIDTVFNQQNSNDNNNKTDNATTNNLNRKSENSNNNDNHHSNNDNNHNNNRADHHHHHHHHRQPLYVSSTKGATGHLLGAAGAIESAFTCLSLRDNIIPPTLNLISTPVGETYHSFRHVPEHAIDYETGETLMTVGSKIFADAMIDKKDDDNNDDKDDDVIITSLDDSKDIHNNNNKKVNNKYKNIEINPSIIASSNQLTYSSIMTKSATPSSSSPSPPIQLKHAMKNSFGFGGVNATLIFSKYSINNNKSK